MSGSSTKPEPPGKLTSDLLARKGQARPADLLDGDSLLVSSQNRTPLTLIRSDEPVITGLFGDEETRLQRDGAIESGSLLDFSLARPGYGEVRDDEGRAPGEKQAEGRAPDRAGSESDGGVNSSSVSEPATAESEREQSPVDTEDPVVRRADGLPGGRPAKPMASEEAVADTGAAGNYLPRILILAVLLVISFAAGLWIVAWVNRSPMEGVRNVNLPVDNRLLDQDATIAEPTAISDLPAVPDQNIPAVPLIPRSSGIESDQVRELNPPATEQKTIAQSDKTAAITSTNVSRDIELDPQVPPAPSLPTATADPPSISVPAAVSGGDSVGTAATAESDTAASEPELKPAIDDLAAATVLPRPNPKHTPTDTVPSSSDESAQAGGAAPAGYVVQLLAGRDLKNVTWEKDRLLQRFPQVAGPGGLEIIKVESGNQPVFYRVRTAPFDDAASARSLCRTLKQANQDCLVLKQ